MRLWVADGEDGLYLLGREGRKRIGPPGDALCECRGLVCCAGRGRCAGYDLKTGRQQWDAAVPGEVCALAGLGDLICALSQDADSVTALCASSGEALFTAPAGVYPRDLCADPQGRYLAVAGGAAGEILVMDAALRCVQKYRVPGTACGVCFLPRCLMALCAVEDENLSARLLRISFRGVAEEMFKQALVPACLCALPGGGCAVGCHGAVTCLNTALRPLHARAFPFPARLRAGKTGLMVCDPCLGAVSLLSGETLFRGPSPQDALMTK
ncbi:MAG: hypothetical protein IKQ41_02605 [Clostridia bacterium]|nr:hypothetical protein [Clostridia bacterium]